MAQAKVIGVSAQAPLVAATQVVKDLWSLTKPGVLVLLLISTICPMVLAAGGLPDWKLVIATFIGGWLVSGSASAINCVWEKDTDKLMLRTKNRPIPAGRISPTLGVVFALTIGFIGLLLLAAVVNPLAATISLLGHLFYVFVYTMWLKPTTAQNIVIGGAAGAVPPMVGWAAVTGTVDLTSILLFLLVFLWTPPHFWALALNKNEDYRRAGIPMLPVVAGERVTHTQMLCYAVSLLPVSTLLVFSNPRLGWFSLLILSALGAVFVFKTYQLRQLGGASKEIREKKAWDVFGFSLIYLALFFICLVLDATVV